MCFAFGSQLLITGWLFCHALLVIWLGIHASAQDECSPKDPSFIRIGDTRFFIHHNEKREKDYFHNFNEAHALCAKHGMRVPKIDNMTTFAIVARPLEAHVWKEKLRDTWYWLDAKWDKIKESYVWNGTQQVVKYGNFVQRYPRPIGVGAHSDYNHVYQKERDEDQCLALALPWPNNINPKAKPSDVYGHSTSIDERACDAKMNKHAMCESTDPKCFSKRDTNYGIVEGKASYFEDGNWIIGDRKFIINWKHLDKNASRQYCEDLDLKLYNPNVSTDNCLIPFIKMWSRGITRSQWWTDWEYDSVEKVYYNAEKVEMHRVKGNSAVRMNMKTSKTAGTFCVAMSHEYEFRSQFPCPDPSRDEICKWHFIDYVPANCNNYHAIVCQHPDYKQRSCEFSKKFILNVQLALNKTATVPFGWDSNPNLHRSRYKQVFGSLICPEGFRMLRANNSKAWAKPTDSSIKAYKYDLMESYWVVDKEGFAKEETGLCTLSLPKKGDMWQREHEQRPCNEWHFYLCEQVNAPGSTQFPHKSPPNMTWGNMVEYKRKYPHIPT